MVTRAEFIKAIRAFKRKHRVKLPSVKLKELLNEKSNPEAVKEFLSDSVIQAYLARPSVMFIDRHPQLRDSTTNLERDLSDHYELKIYKCLPNAVIYRNSDITSPKFYTSGTADQHKVFSKLLRAFSQADIEVGYPCDIYAIVSEVSTRFLNVQGETSPRFLIHANWKDTHATTCITILDPVTHHQLITFFMNSYKSEHYYEQIKERFFKENYLSFETSPASIKEYIKKYLTKTFSIDFDGDSINFNRDSLVGSPSSILINKKERAVVTINYTYDDYNSDAYNNLQSDNEIQTICNFTMNKDQESPNIRITHKPKVPFVDVSHNLQLSTDDSNCVLYSMNFIEAIVKMLKQPVVADRVFELARKVTTDSGATQNLVNIFQEELKAYLPCYYDKDTKQAKSSKDLEDFHLKQRWLIGGQSLAILHPIEQQVSVDVLSYESSHTSENTDSATSIIEEVPKIAPIFEQDTKRVPVLPSDAPSNSQLIELSIQNTDSAPSLIENDTLLSTVVPKIAPLFDQYTKDQLSVTGSPSEASNNSQLIELSIQNNEPHRALSVNTGVEYNDPASELMKKELLQKIQVMQEYGALLKDQNASKGQAIIDLSNELTLEANQFFDQEPEQRNFTEFQPRFLKLLHSKDQEMSAYRLAWGTIIANIAIALTGIGLLFIAGKLIHSKITENRALFFFQKSKTTSEEKIADVEHALVNCKSLAVHM